MKTTKYYKVTGEITEMNYWSIHNSGWDLDIIEVPEQCFIKPGKPNQPPLQHIIETGTDSPRGVFTEVRPLNRYTRMRGEREYVIEADKMVMVPGFYDFMINGRLIAREPDDCAIFNIDYAIDK